jgi:transposase
MQHPPIEVLASVPGIDVKTGARVLREVGDASTFATSGHHAAYARLAPVTRRASPGLARVCSTNALALFRQ